MKPVAVLIVDDHAVVREGLRLLFEGKAGFEVVGETGSGGEALELARSKRPDVVLLDLDLGLGGENGLDLIPRLVATAPGLRVLVLTGMRDPEAHRRAIQLGASGVVAKETAADTLREALSRVHAGEAWLDPALAGTVLRDVWRKKKEAGSESLRDARIATLTAREREVISLLGEGLKNREISRRLGISETTVRHHLTSVFDKLEVKDRLELLIYAYRHNLAKRPG